MATAPVISDRNAWTPPKVTSVAPEPSFVLRIEWEDGRRSRIDLSGLLSGHRLFHPLLADPALFETVHVGEYGWDIAWNDDIDMSRQTLWQLADEQERAEAAALRSA